MQSLVVIEAGRTERHYWLDLWRYRELFRVLAWRDLAVRYKQTVIGVLWAVNQTPSDYARVHIRFWSHRWAYLQRETHLTHYWCSLAYCRGRSFPAR